MTVAGAALVTLKAMVYIIDTYQLTGRAMADLAKIFWNGRSQAVRLPKEFRFEGTEVRIRREGRRVILTPADVDYTTDDIALDVTRGIEELRALIAEGEDESGDAELDMQAIIREQRARYDARKKD